MLLPVDEPVNIPVSLIYIVEGDPVVASGALVWFEPGQEARIQVHGTVALPAEGVEVRVHGVLDTTLQLRGPVRGTEDRIIDVFPEEVVQQELRRHPRAYGGLNLRYCSGKKPDDGDRWMLGAANLETDTGWHEPEPFMEFSASGLLFTDEQFWQIGQVLLLEMRLPREEHGWRGVGRVVRVESAHPRSPGTRHYHIALEFLNLPDEARTALHRASEQRDT